ncbi:hypothetical protein GMOD_00001950 [Pyrenophora seminiperda CCB06]|uniref:Uncharacterized protein n=1 Tax=Pyrenophora seminiperda CCB06 TaxID=1302712 RepID=A0A3M7LWM9_9PLEO|nr:hypothetical protein GMOD_00001950 [Pyrenophora seminiperda CCB06]
MLKSEKSGSTPTEPKDSTESGPEKTSELEVKRAATAIKDHSVELEPESATEPVPEEPQMPVDEAKPTKEPVPESSKVPLVEIPFAKIEEPATEPMREEPSNAHDEPSALPLEDTVEKAAPNVEPEPGATAETPQATHAPAMRVAVPASEDSKEPTGEPPIESQREPVMQPTPGILSEEPEVAQPEPETPPSAHSAPDPELVEEPIATEPVEPPLPIEPVPTSTLTEPEVIPPLGPTPIPAPEAEPVLQVPAAEPLATEPIEPTPPSELILGSKPVVDEQWAAALLDGPDLESASKPIEESVEEPVLQIPAADPVATAPIEPVLVADKPPQIFAHIAEPTATETTETPSRNEPVLRMEPIIEESQAEAAPDLTLRPVSRAIVATPAPVAPRVDTLAEIKPSRPAAPKGSLAATKASSITTTATTATFKLLAAMRAPHESVPILVLLRQKKKAGEDVRDIADTMLAAAES